MRTSKPKRPKPNLTMTRMDWGLEVVSALCLILAVGLVASAYNSLPDIIPMHFGASGEADAFKDKSLIWIMPSVSGVVYLILTFCARMPDLLNYPYEITEENAQRQYQNVVMMMRGVKILITLVSLYITLATIRTSEGTMNGLGSWFLPAVVIGIPGAAIFFIVRGFRLN